MLVSCALIWSILTISSSLLTVSGAAIGTGIDNPARFCKNRRFPHDEEEQSQFTGGSNGEGSLAQDALHDLYSPHGNGKSINVTSVGSGLGDRDIVARDLPPGINCHTENAVCITLLDGIQYKAGPSPAYLLLTSNREPIFLYWYFEPTVLFTGTGGSATVYPAHGCIDVCVRGRMRVHFVSQRITLDGDFKNPDRVKCWSATKDLSDDLVLSLV
ncbi:unnamed protein product [Parajaminaea phylloscopi]